MKIFKTNILLQNQPTKNLLQNNSIKSLLQNKEQNYMSLKIYKIHLNPQIKQTGTIDSIKTKLKFKKNTPNLKTFSDNKKINSINNHQRI